MRVVGCWISLCHCKYLNIKSNSPSTSFFFGCKHSKTPRGLSELTPLCKLLHKTNSTLALQYHKFIPVKCLLTADLQHSTWLSFNAWAEMWCVESSWEQLMLGQKNMDYRGHGGDLLQRRCLFMALLLMLSWMSHQVPSVLMSTGVQAICFYRKGLYRIMCPQKSSIIENNLCELCRNTHGCCTARNRGESHYWACKTWLWRFDIQAP